MARVGAKAGDDKPEPGAELGADEPLADWERELLAGDAAAATAVADAVADAAADAAETAEAPVAEAPVAEAGDAPAQA